LGRRKLTKEKATEVSGVKTVLWLSDFDRIFYNLMNEAESIYLNKNEHYRAVLEVQTREDRFIERVKKEFPLHKF
jgi:Xaa-Pro aminopeptidase